MPMIATQIEPRRVTRIFFDCRDAVADPADQRRIERAIGASIALGQGDDDAPEVFLLAG
jgi:hypothetical protein